MKVLLQNSFWFALLLCLGISCSIKPKQKSTTNQFGKHIKVNQQKNSVKFDSIIQLQNATKQILFVKEKFVNGKSESNLYVKTDKFKENVNLIIEDQDPLEDVQLYDLNLDGNDELFIFTRSVGSGSYAGLVAFLSDGLTLHPIFLPEIKEKDLDKNQYFDGYRGHDKFELVESELIRKFPVYLTNDINSNPTGGNKIIVYQLKKRLNQWVFEIEDTYFEKVKVTVD